MLTVMQPALFAQTAAPDGDCSGLHNAEPLVACMNKHSCQSRQLSALIVRNLVKVTNKLLRDIDIDIDSLAFCLCVP